MIVFAPLYFHFGETIQLFKLLLIENETFYQLLGKFEKLNIWSGWRFSLEFILAHFYLVVLFKIYGTVVVFAHVSCVLAGVTGSEACVLRKKAFMMLSIFHFFIMKF